MPLRRGIEPRPQLLTYPDSMGGDLQALGALVDGPLSGLFRGIHILPPFPSSGDRGFAPLTHERIDPRFGAWGDIERLAERHEVVLDLVVNHLSRESDEFQDFRRQGRDSSSADLFITLDKVWHDGQPREADVSRIFLRKPDSPFTTVTVEATGLEERIWTSFGSAGWSEQIDLDMTSPAGRSLVTAWMRTFADHGVSIVRLDAVGYVIKKAGTSCFMVEPEIYDFLDWITGVADALGLAVLPEVHDIRATHERLSQHGYWTYDFVLPGLLLHAFHSRSTRRLAAHLARSPARQVTILDCHDGIPIRPDLDGILEPIEMSDLAARIQALGGNVNRILSKAHTTAGDIHQLNCTYLSALGGDEEQYVAARAIQLFARGVPQIYYVGLLGGANDHLAVARTGEGRDINRHDYSLDEIDAELQRPVVRRIIDLIRLRRTHPAFEGVLTVEADDEWLRMAWVHRDGDLRLGVDLAAGHAMLIDDGRTESIAEWR